ncbi:hypothetical protein BLA29_008121 [Euroglyphus maynei]|uniref:Uncharacterized protein n=1 Tax=Euroglyphus maynei TaxID=6958 RepID=A0A1Y3BCY7_EURMA|nr:hypothetical protein BLA29_008121 [Euroglyphus maynei]
MVVQTREIFSPVKDIIKISITDTMATFELHCSMHINVDGCRFILFKDDDGGKFIKSEIQLQPKRSYQLYTFENLEPKHWYRITKMIDDNVIESGRFQTRMSPPSVPQIRELFCLNGDELLVRWSFYEESGEEYSFLIEWWPNIDSNHSSSTIVTIHNGTQDYMIDPYVSCCFLSNNF